MYDYKKELEEMEGKMIAAAKFADKLPLFTEIIMKNKLAGTEEWLRLGEKYKDIYLNWGVNRGFYKAGTSRHITNCKEEHCGYFFNVYVNCYSLFDLHENFDLYESLKDVDIYFADKMNSTFYITDENIEPFLEALNAWYLKARSKVRAVKLRTSLERAKEDVKEYTRLLEECIQIENNNDNRQAQATTA